MALPEVKLGVLPNADGSVQLSQNGYVVIAAVNGPVEAQRRDEVPEEVFIEVNVRALSGPGGPVDRDLEMNIRNTLSAVVDLRAFPRQMIQVTLQVLRVPESSHTVETPSQHRSAVPLLPPLINAATLALLNGNIPLLSICAACLIYKPSAGRYAPGNGKGELEAQEFHAYAYNAFGDLLLHSAEGRFDSSDWIETTRLSREVCCEDNGLLQWLRSTTSDNVTKSNAWRQQSE